MYDAPQTVLGQLWTYGQSNAFTKDGLPKVSAVNYHYTGTATPEGNDKIWHELYGFATYRGFYQREGYKQAKQV